MARVLKWIALLLALAIGVAAAVYLPPLRAMASIGAGFVAKQMCSCVYVSDRSYASCRPDMMEMMDAIEAELVAGAGAPGVRAIAPGFFVERVASYDEGFGCTLD